MHPIRQVLILLHECTGAVGIYQGVIYYKDRAGCAYWDTAFNQWLRCRANAEVVWLKEI